MEDKKAMIRVWIKDMANHESIQAMADGYRGCLPAFDGQKAALEIEQLILDTKNQIILCETGSTLETSRFCHRLMAMQRVIRKWREIQ